MVRLDCGWTRDVSLSVSLRLVVVVVVAVHLAPEDTRYADVDALK